jgi:hypothetical protein
MIAGYNRYDPNDFILAIMAETGLGLQEKIAAEDFFSLPFYVETYTM